MHSELFLQEINKAVAAAAALKHLRQPIALDGSNDELRALFESIEPGQPLPNGAVYVDKKRDGTQVFTTPKDIGHMSRSNANDRLRMRLHGLNGWHVADFEEGELQFNVRRSGLLSGTFKESSNFFDGGRGYWLAAYSHPYGWAKDFKTGKDSTITPHFNLNVRPNMAIKFTT